MTRKPNHLWIEANFNRLHMSQSGTGGRVVEVNLYPVKREPNEPRRYFGVMDDEFGYLTAMSYVFDKYNLPNRADIFYKSSPSVGLRKARVMAAFLGKLDRRMTSQVEKNGLPQTFGQWVLQFCNAMGAVGLTVERNGQIIELRNGQIVGYIDEQIRNERNWTETGE